MCFDFAKTLHDLKYAKDESGQELNKPHMGEADSNAIALSCV